MAGARTLGDEPFEADPLTPRVGTMRPHLLAEHKLLAVSTYAFTRRLEQSLAPQLSLSVRSGPASFEQGLDAALVEEISAHYEDLDQGFIGTHVPPAGSFRGSRSASSSVKFAALIWAGSTPVGKCVLTFKRGGRIKVGPLYIVPSQRGRELATATLIYILDAARDAGYLRVYATVALANHAAVALVERCGFERQLTLSRHYSALCDEAVYVRELNRLARRILTDDRTTFLPVSHPRRMWCDQSEAPLRHKRGGSTTVIVADAPAVSSYVIREWEAEATRLRRRKLTVVWPHSDCEASLPAHYMKEGEFAMSGDEAFERVAIYSAFAGEERTFGSFTPHGTQRQSAVALDRREATDGRSA